MQCIIITKSNQRSFKIIGGITDRRFPNRAFATTKYCKPNGKRTFESQYSVAVSFIKTKDNGKEFSQTCSENVLQTTFSDNVFQNMFFGRCLPEDVWRETFSRQRAADIFSRTCFGSPSVLSKKMENTKNNKHESTNK